MSNRRKATARDIATRFRVGVVPTVKLAENTCCKNPERCEIPVGMVVEEIAVEMAGQENFELPTSGVKLEARKKIARDIVSKCPRR